jgi:hypothetical protein
VRRWRRSQRSSDSPVVAQFGTFTQSEEGLGAPCVTPGDGDGHDFVETHIGRRDVRGRLGERAVPAAVTTEFREWDEDFGGVRHDETVKRSRFLKRGGRQGRRRGIQ